MVFWLAAWLQVSTVALTELMARLVGGAFCDTTEHSGAAENALAKVMGQLPGS
jgi:hypothetical protein